MVLLKNEFVLPSAYAPRNFDFPKRILRTPGHNIFSRPCFERFLIGEAIKSKVDHETMTRIIDFHTKNRAKYTYDIDTNAHTIAIRDIAGSSKTVASDAENVIEDLVERGYPVDRFSIQYQNSLGIWGKLLTANSAFSGFALAA